MSLSSLITSKYLYPLWRIGWPERAFFRLCRWFDRPLQRLFDMSKLGFDVSYYQGTIDFLKMKGYGALFVILRCGYAKTEDTRFQQYIASAPNYLPVSVYHFYDPVVPPMEQAQRVITTLASHKSKICRVWLDFEFWWTGSYSDPKHWVTYYNAIKAAGYKVGVYTRATWWDSRVGIYLSTFTSDPVWAAQYNTQLTLIPKGYSKAMIWQDGTPAIGIAAGVSSQEIDRNRWNEDYSFANEWGKTTTPQPNPITDGYQKLRRNNADIHLWRGVPLRVKVTDNKGILLRPSSFISSRAQVIVNGDGWDKTPGITYHKPLSLAVSDGVTTQDIQFDGRPFYNAPFTISHIKPAGAKNLVSGTRYLVQAGGNSFLTSTSPEHITELHPRTAIGYTRDGKLIACVVDGRSTVSAGITLRNLAFVLIEAGAWYALELDGGDSSILLMEGIKKSANGDPINGMRTERATVNSVLIFTQEPPMPETFDYYLYTTTNERHAIRQMQNGVVNVLSPYVLINNVAQNWYAGKQARGKATAADVYVLPAAVKNSAGQTVGLAGDVWRRIYLNDGIAVDGWIADIHMGAATLNKQLIEANPDPEPSAKPAKIDMTLAVGSVVTVKDENGNTLWTGTA